jgi:hypothetical protein
VRGKVAVPPSPPRFSDAVFINCPFDAGYWPIFEAIVFCILDCGFVPRCALEEADSGAFRLSKIQEIIRRAEYTIHDLSRVEISVDTRLPRFNMPFELGLDIGCRVYGSGQARKKKCLILDSDPHRYKAFLSDISGQDIQSHQNSPAKAVNVVRHWLRIVSKRSSIPGPIAINGRFARFTSDLPTLCDKSGLDRNDLQFVEYVALAEAWLRADKELPRTSTKKRILT